MRIERVSAIAFGPLLDQTLEFSDGLNVVFGPNEAGKSTWHAALYAGLCGVRRSRGQPIAEDRAFRDLHMPWDGERWDVEVLVRLEDGRRIDIRQDLAGKVDCRATDVSLGTDVSNEIMFEGSPDGSRWLGLDRRAFRATACIGQAQLLGIADDPDLLQEHMQRAAATRGSDATAAQAIDGLEAFRRAQVGEDRANSTRPLRRAKVGRDEAEAELAEATRQHATFLLLGEAADGAARRAGETAAELGSLQALAARRASDEARRRASRATEIAGRYPDGPPLGPIADEDLASRVASAVDAWERRPEPILLDGPTSHELSLSLDQLPPVPAGDLAPAAEVVGAKAAFDREREAVRLLSDPTLERGASGIAIGAAGAVATAAGAGSRAPGQRPVILAGGALALAFAGLVAVPVSVALGVALLVPAVVLALWAAIEHRRALSVGQPVGRASDGMADGWAARRAERTAALRLSESRLAGLLESRGITIADLDEGYERYLADCQRRAGQARTAAPADDLRARVEAKRDLEQRAAQTADLVARIEAELRQVAAQVGVGEPERGARLEGREGGRGFEDTVAGLRAWQADRTRNLEAQETARHEWQELEMLLRADSLVDLRGEAERLAARAEELRRGIAPGAAASIDAAANPDHRIAELQAELATRRSEADRLAGQLAQMAGSLPSVAEAEERLAAADAQLARVAQLERVLITTIELLRQAEQQVHRDLAPVLGSAIARSLPRISGGRYVDAAVNPADLAVKVKSSGDGHWRDARLLSHGTQEQIYLLLRIAMADQLVADGEISPLICDEVTVQSDEARALELLRLLQEASRERQVIVLTHDERALAWAEANLVDGRDRLIQLGPQLARA